MANSAASAAGSAAASATVHAVRLRLTRRGRLVLVAAVTMLTVLAGLTLGLGSSLAASGGPAPDAARHTVILAPGQTLWSLATRIAPHDDPRLVVADIEALNHLTGAPVQAGQRLIVPQIS